MGWECEWLGVDSLPSRKKAGGCVLHRKNITISMCLIVKPWKVLVAQCTSQESLVLVIHACCLYCA